MDLDNAVLARILTSLTLGFHIIFAALGVGIPLMVSIAEWVGIRKKDPMYTLMARRWVKGYTITVAVGVVTGTSIGLQLNLLWPSFMKIAGEAISLPLFLETFAFFFEAIFLGIYLYTWDRFKNPWVHWAISLPVVIGSTASAFFIMTVNAFMNSPQGFDLVDGRIVNVQPIAAMFNAATPSKTGHMILSSYAATAFVLAAIAAYRMMKGERTNLYYQKGLKFTMIFALIFSIGTAFWGDIAGKYLAEYQPAKLAAAEWHFETAKKAELLVGGVLNPETHEVEYALKLPYLLSILATGTPDGTVIGLNDIPVDERPPLFIHYLFDAMVGIGTYMILVPILFFAWRRWKKGEVPAWIHRLIFWGGPLAFLAIEFGWIFSEIGRQPWILVGYMKTAHAATTANNVGQMLVLFSLLYLFLGIMSSRVLNRMFGKKSPEIELYDNPPTSM